MSGLCPPLTAVTWLYCTGKIRAEPPQCNMDLFPFDLILPADYRVCNSTLYTAPAETDTIASTVYTTRASRDFLQFPFPWLEDSSPVCSDALSSASVDDMNTNPVYRWLSVERNHTVHHINHDGGGGGGGLDFAGSIGGGGGQCPPPPTP